MNEKILRSEEALEIYEQIKELPIFDVHTHLRYKKPCMSNAWDLLSYHYFTEIAHSMDFSLDGVKDSEEGVKKMFEYLPAMRTTAPYFWLEQMAKKLFDCGIRDWREFYERVEQNVSSSDWMKKVIETSHIERIALTNNPWESFEGIDKELFFPTFRADPLLKFDNRVVKDTFEETESFLEERINHFTGYGCKAVAISPPDDFVYTSSASRNNSALKDAALSASAKEKNEVRSSLLSILAALCREKKLPFEIMFGSVRDIYRRCVPEGGDFSRANTSLLNIADIFNDNPEVIFPLSIVSFTNDQELAEFARVFANVYASGHWWFTNTESAIEGSLKKRLEVSPYKKHIGYYSDAYTMELIWAKFDFYRRVESNVFADLVRGKRLTVDEAVEIIRVRDYETPKKMFS
ncbi:MAG: glucuronate isomerase [Candidatus Thermoplasmatota archaeon]|nr:glucuronate isomerase [Candidatus Thermoplasmatota archaeon]